ncbi:MAG: hypothetical protein C0423_21630 [Methylibium sp.]|nr:hypothetical protein [Methylibium sp.]
MIARLFTARFGVSALVLALAAWLLAPDEPQSSAVIVRAQRDSWNPGSALRRPVLSAQAIEVGGASVWGVQPQRAGTTASATPEDSRWRIAGLFGRGAERRVLIEYLAPGKAPHYLKTGDKLPSGHRITSVSDREVCVQIGKRAYRFAVQRSDS